MQMARGTCCSLVTRMFSHPGRHVEYSVARDKSPLLAIALDSFYTGRIRVNPSQKNVKGGRSFSRQRMDQFLFGNGIVSFRTRSLKRNEIVPERYGGSVESLSLPLVSCKRDPMFNSLFTH